MQQMAVPGPLQRRTLQKCNTGRLMLQETTSTIVEELYRDSCGSCLIWHCWSLLRISGLQVPDYDAALDLMVSLLENIIRTKN